MSVQGRYPELKDTPGFGGGVGILEVSGGMGVDRGASSGASKVKRHDAGFLEAVIASSIRGARSCSAKTKGALEILSVWVSSWCVYEGFVPAKMPPPL